MSVTVCSGIIVSVMLGSDMPQSLGSAAAKCLRGSIKPKTTVIYMYFDA